MDDWKKTHRKKTYTLNETEEKIARLDELVAKGCFPSRSEAVRFGNMLTIRLFDDFKLPPLEAFKKMELPRVNLETVTVGDTKQSGGYLWEYRQYDGFVKWCAVGVIRS